MNIMRICFGNTRKAVLLTALCVCLVCLTTVPVYYLTKVVVRKHQIGGSGEPSLYYIDVGANRGDTLRSFYQKRVPEDANNKAMALPYDYDPSKWKVFAFEADAVHTPTLRRLQRQYNFTLYAETAAWVDDGGIQLYLDRSEKEKGYWGTSVSKTRKGIKSEERIKSVDFSTWLQYHVLPEDFVVMKMNIEGAEFAIFDKMLREDTFCLIDQLFISYHAKVVFRRKNVIANHMPDRVKKKSLEPNCAVQILLQTEH